MRYILTVLVFAAMTVTPSFAVAVGGGCGGHASVASSPTPQQGTSEKSQKEAKAPQGDQGEKQVLATKNNK